MSRFYANLPNLVIASTATTATTAITSGLDDAVAVIVGAPSALTGTVTLRGSMDGGTTFLDIGSGGSDVTIAAGNAVTISPFPYSALSVLSSTTEATARTFTVGKQFDVQ